jgi:uncharacterized protein
MRILRAENYRRMRWKNGGGETAEIAVSPEGAGLDDFCWRVSMATVEADGPFSTFSGVDRTLSILEGEGILLSVEGRVPVGLTSRSDPLPFPADVATSAALIAGPIIDLNVMARRGRYRHKVSTHELKGSTVISFAGVEALLFCRAGSMLASGDGRQVTLGRFDAAIPGSAALRLEGSAKFFTVEFHGV